MEHAGIEPTGMEHAEIIQLSDKSEKEQPRTGIKTGRG